MSWPEPKTGSPSNVSATTRCSRTTTFTSGNSQTASGQTWPASTTGTSTSRAIRRTAKPRRSTSQSKRSRQLHQQKGRRVLAAALFLRGVLLGERGDSGCLVVLDVKDGVKLGDLQQVMDLLGQVQQLQLAATVLDGRECADQLADAGAVDVVDVAEIQQNLVGTLCQYIPDRVTDGDAAFAEGDPAAEIQNGNAVHLTSLYFHAHESCSPYVPGCAGVLCLISVSSVPGCNWRKFTSSMNALIRKMPRPDPRRIFSGAKGSGTLSGSSPGPWSAMRIINESEVVSNEATICLLVSYELPCSTAFTAASRTAMAICGIVSSSNPAR